MKKILLSSILALLVLFSACAEKEMVKDDSAIKAGKKDILPKSAGIVSTPEMVVDGLNDFAFDIYRQMNESSQANEFISPLSISSALAMTYAGSEGLTAEQMQQAMHYGPQRRQFHADYGVILDSLSKSNKDFEINIANAVWVQDKFPLLEKYVKTVKLDYKSESRELDFAKKPEVSRNTINSWVEDKTNDRIQDLIPRGVIDADTRMILTNAVYFNAEWAEHFRKDLTRSETFYLLEDGQNTCDMMHRRGHFAYSKINGTQILEIPYKGYQYSMMILLPEQRNGLKNLIKNIDKNMLMKYENNKTWEDVLLYMPKYKLETDYQLRPALAALGMEIPFSDDADFSGMTGRKDLKISDVIHKAFIEVDEIKTEAAAATAVVMKLTSMAPAQRAPIEFRADHPFMFLIKHKESGAILFMGQVTNPGVE